MKKIVIAITCMAFLFSACEKTVKNIKIENKQQKLVINARIQADSLIKVHLSRSLSLYETDSLYVFPNATVKMTESDANTSVLSYSDDGYFIAKDHYAKPGKTYHIEASNVGFETATAVVDVPHKPEIISIDTSETMQTDPDCIGCELERKFEVTVKFKDIPGVNEFYSVEAKGIIKHVEYEEVIIEEPFYHIEWVPVASYLVNQNMYIRSTESFVEVTKDQNYFWLVTPDWYPDGNVLYFSDKLIDGDNVEFTLTFDFYERTEDDSIHIYLNRINEEHFKYVTSRAKADEVEDNPIAEQVTLYNNITNGLGHAFGIAADRYSFKVEK